eukprot:490348-Pyramimonas_sp.AAC.1
MWDSPFPRSRSSPLSPPPCDAARALANLPLQPEKCRVVPPAESCTPAVEAKFQSMIADLAHQWSEFHVRGHTTSLGIEFGPGASLEQQWAAPSQKWRARTIETALSRSPAEASSRLYNFCTPPCP